METECSWLPVATLPSSRSCCPSSTSTHRTSCRSYKSSSSSSNRSSKSSTHQRSTSTCHSLLSSSSPSSSCSSSSLSLSSQPTASSSGGSSNNSNNNRHQRVMSSYSSASTCSSSSSSSCVMIWWQCILLFITLILTPNAVNAQYKPQWPDPMLAREIFVLNLEDGYFGCQVNESVDFLQLFELSKLCDGAPQCFRGSDELSVQLKCTDRSKYLSLCLCLCVCLCCVISTTAAATNCVHSSFARMSMFGVRCIEKLI